LRAEANLLRDQTKNSAALQQKIRRLQSPPERETKTSMQVREMSWARQICVQAWANAFILYARKNQGQLPTSFEQAQAYWLKEIQKESEMTAEQFETQYGN